MKDAQPVCTFAKIPFTASESRFLFFPVPPSFPRRGVHNFQTRQKHLANKSTLKYGHPSKRRLRKERRTRMNPAVIIVAVAVVVVAAVAIIIKKRKG